jgi:DNA-binding CsgD family transcriptional regulator
MQAYKELLPYAETEKEKQVLNLLIEGKSQRTIASLAGKSRSAIQDTLKRVKIRAANKDPELHKGKQPEGYEIKGVSTLYDDEGNAKLQWVKTSQDKEEQDRLFKEAADAFKDEIKPCKPVKSPKLTEKELLNLYVITDYHIGMLAWDEEAGENWDTNIAEQLLYKWFEKAISLSPDSETGILCNLGDFVHYDGLEAITPAHHNVLDADSRFQKLVRVTIRLFRRIIEDLLKKHKKVHVIMAEGNHDPASSIWLREWLDAFYAKEKRVFIDVSPDPYYCYEHGQTSLFFHHGHKRKLDNVDSVFTAKFRDVFGRTKYSYGHQGHLHNRQVKESNLMILEQHRTLAAKDAYASRGGWMSGREAQCISYHKEYGEVGRVVINPEMVK